MFTAGLTYAAYYVNMPAFLAFALLTLAYLLLGLANIVNPGDTATLLTKLGGWVLIVDGLCAWYLSLGAGVNSVVGDRIPLLPYPYGSAATKEAPGGRHADARGLTASRHPAGSARRRRRARPHTTAVGGDRRVARLLEAAQDAANREPVAAALEQRHRARRRVGDDDRAAAGDSMLRGASSVATRARRRPLARSTTATKPSVSAVARARGARRGGAAVRRRAAPGRRARRHAGARGGSRPLIRGRHAQRSRRARAVVLHLPLVRDGPRCVTGACDHGA